MGDSVCFEWGTVDNELWTCTFRIGSTVKFGGTVQRTITGNYVCSLGPLAPLSYKSLGFAKQVVEQALIERNLVNG